MQHPIVTSMLIGALSIPMTALAVTPGPGVGAPGVGVVPCVATPVRPCPVAPVVRPGVGVTPTPGVGVNTPANRGGPVNRAGRH